MDGNGRKGDDRVRHAIGNSTQNFRTPRPILDTAYDGVKNLEFAPATRVAYNLSEAWALAAEEYADYGPVHHFYSGSNQVHQLYAVVDRSSKALDIEIGIGFGLTTATDKLALKLLLIRDLNSPH